MPSKEQRTLKAQAIVISRVGICPIAYFISSENVIPLPQETILQPQRGLCVMPFGNGYFRNLNRAESLKAQRRCPNKILQDSLPKHTQDWIRHDDEQQCWFVPFETMRHQLTFTSATDILGAPVRFGRALRAGRWREDRDSSQQIASPAREKASPIVKRKSVIMKALS